jgi:hypothetical protein
MAKKQPTENPENLLDELDSKLTVEAGVEPPVGSDGMPEIPKGATVKQLEELEQRARPTFHPICKMHVVWMKSGGSYPAFTYFSCPVEGCSESCKVARKTPAQVMDAARERGFEAR